MKYYRLEPALAAISKKPAEEFGMVYTLPIKPLGPYCMIGHLYLHNFGPLTNQERMRRNINCVQDVSDAYAVPRDTVRDLYIFSTNGKVPAPYYHMAEFDNLIPPPDRKDIMLQTLRTLMIDGIVDYSPYVLAYLSTQGLTTNAP